MRIASSARSPSPARIESSKAYARDVMTRMGVPQPEHARFEDWASAAAYLGLVVVIR